jgi:hypothetical protein
MTARRQRVRALRVAPERRSLTDDGARAELADLVAVDLRDQHAVEDEVQLVAPLTL